MTLKTIYLLIGPKGSGKSFIGMLFAQHFDIPFVRVEDWVREIRRDRSVIDDLYLAEAFTVIEQGVRTALKNTEGLVFESTGLTSYFDRMLAKLEADFRVITVKISADPQVCLERVQSRDQSIHINISGEEVLKINQQVLTRNLSCRYQIENTSKSRKELLAEIKGIV